MSISLNTSYTVDSSNFIIDTSDTQALASNGTTTYENWNLSATAGTASSYTNGYNWTVGGVTFGIETSFPSNTNYRGAQYCAYTGVPFTVRFRDSVGNNGNQNPIIGATMIYSTAGSWTAPNLTFRSSGGTITFASGTASSWRIMHYSNIINPGNTTKLEYTYTPLSGIACAPYKCPVVNGKLYSGFGVTAYLVLFTYDADNKRIIVRYAPFWLRVLDITVSYKVTQGDATGAIKPYYKSVAPWNYDNSETKYFIFQMNNYQPKVTISVKHSYYTKSYDITPDVNNRTMYAILDNNFIRLIDEARTGDLATELPYAPTSIPTIGYSVKLGRYNDGTVPITLTRVYSSGYTAPDSTGISAAIYINGTKYTTYTVKTSSVTYNIPNVTYGALIHVSMSNPSAVYAGETMICTVLSDLVELQYIDPIIDINADGSHIGILSTAGLSDGEYKLITPEIDLCGGTWIDHATMLCAPANEYLGDGGIDTGHVCTYESEQFLSGVATEAYYSSPRSFWSSGYQSVYGVNNTMPWIDTFNFHRKYNCGVVAEENCNLRSMSRILGRPLINTDMFGVKACHSRPSPNFNTMFPEEGVQLGAIPSTTLNSFIKMQYYSKGAYNWQRWDYPMRARLDITPLVPPEQRYPQGTTGGLASRLGDETRIINKSGWPIRPDTLSNANVLWNISTWCYPGTPTYTIYDTKHDNYIADLRKNLPGYNTYRTHNHSFIPNFSKYGHNERKLQAMPYTITEASDSATPRTIQY